MRIISIKVLKEFIDKHPQSKSSLEAWWNEAKVANWQNSQQIKEKYASASFVGNNRVVFNIKGNDFRLVVAVAYRFGAIYIKFVGTHEEYNKINVETVER
jgi:mRNA interferase HigB